MGSVIHHDEKRKEGESGRTVRIGSAECHALVLQLFCKASGSGAANAQVLAALGRSFVRADDQNMGGTRGGKSAPFAQDAAKQVAGTERSDHLAAFR